MMELQSDTQVLEGVRLAIYYTEKDLNIQKQIAAYGFTPKHMQHGKTLLAKVLLLQAMRLSRDDERWNNTQQLQADVKAAQTMFREHVYVVRRAFQHDLVVLSELQIQHIGRKKSEWIQQALHFYTHLEEYVAQLEPFDIDRAVIEQAKASVQALLEIKEKRTRKKGLAKGRIEDKNQAAEVEVYKALETWVTEFQHIARVAFKDNSKMLEVFGMTVFSKQHKDALRL